MTPECQQQPLVGLSRARRKGPACWPTREGCLQGLLLLHKPSAFHGVNDRHQCGWHSIPPPVTTTALSHQIPCGTPSPQNTLPKFKWTTHPGEGGPKAGSIGPDNHWFQCTLSSLLHLQVSAQTPASPKTAAKLRATWCRHREIPSKAKFVSPTHFLPGALLTT